MFLPLSETAGRNDPCPCGSGKKFKKCCKEKISQPFSPATDMSGVLMERASSALNANDLAQAELLTKEVLRINAREIGALHLLATVHLKRMELDAAETLIRQCIALNAGDGTLYFTYGAIRKEQGRIDEAIALNEKALALAPAGYIHYIHTNMGSCFYRKRELAAAIDSFEQALAIDPDFAPALFNRGNAYYALEGAHSARMAADYARATTLDPTNAFMLQKIATIYNEIHDYLTAIRLLRDAIRLKPDMESAWVLLAHCYQEVGNTDTARSLYNHLAEKFPDNVIVKLQSACLLPAIPASVEDISAWRERYIDSLERLCREKFVLAEPESSMLTLPFYQGYHGVNNLNLMKKMAEFFLHSCQVLHFTAPHCVKPMKKKDRIRIGFVSEHFHAELLSQFYGPLLDALCADGRFEVVLIASSGRKNEAVDKLAAATMRYVTLPGHLPLAQQAVAKEELDILIYLAIGLNVMNYMLAFARLAPIQMAMGGHPITTGIPAVDYFISSRAVEAENAQAHYSEKLLLLEKNTVVVQRKPVPVALKTREELGLPEDARLYACPVLLFKIHPDMDKVFSAILKRDPKAIIILFDSAYKTLWRTSLQKRFAESMPPELVERIHFLPHALGDRFYHVMRSVDCALDTFHFSFGTTAFLMLGADVPYVTLPGEFQRGRCGTLLYREMDMPELIAQSAEHYVELALKLAQDKPFRERMIAAIRERSSRIFDDYSVVAPFLDALWQVYDSSFKSL